jgi:hypothetical protein
VRSAYQALESAGRRLSRAMDKWHLIPSPSARIRRGDTGARGRGSRNMPQQPHTTVATAGTHRVGNRMTAETVSSIMQDETARNYSNANS